MKFGALYSYWGNEWYCDYPATLKKMKDAGCDILEVGAGHLLRMSDCELTELRDKARYYGMILTSNIGPPRDKDVSSPDPEIRANGVRFLCDIMRRMDILDSRTLVGVMYSFWPNDFVRVDKSGSWGRAVESARIMSRTADALGITMCQEVVNRFEGYLLNTAAEGVRFCKDVGEKSTRLLLDTFHMNIEEDSIVDAFRQAKGYVHEVHAGEGNRRLPGQGSLPWERIGCVLREIGFDGNVVMEPFLLEGGEVGSDIKVWRDLSGGADESGMSGMLKNAVLFLHSAFKCR